MSKTSREREKNPIKKALRAISTAILVLCTLLCFVVVIRTALNQEVSLLGFRLFYVVTGSMEPTLPVDSLLLVGQRSEYEVGDIITYYAQDAEILGSPNTHRIIEKTVENGVIRYTTQGDANPVPDPHPVTQEQVIGKVCFTFGALGIVGTVLGILGTPGGFFAVVLVPLVIIAVVCMRDFKKALDEDLKRSARAALEAELAVQEQEE